MASKEWRKKNPMHAAYLDLKSNAKRRGHSFSITFDEFKQFCKKTSYMDVKGIYKDSYHIDRIDENKGYHMDNVQLLTNSQNVRKFFDHYYDDSIGKYVFKVKKTPETENKAPF